MFQEEVTEKFAAMILGVQAARTLDENEKSYLIDLLEDQLKHELFAYEYGIPA